MTVAKGEGTRRRYAPCTLSAADRSRDKKKPERALLAARLETMTREHHRIAVEAGASRAAGQRVARARIHSPVNRIVAETARPATARDLGPRSPEWRTN